MVWLWLTFPVALLAAAVLLWRAALRIERRHDGLQAQLDGLRASGPEGLHR